MPGGLYPQSFVLQEALGTADQEPSEEIRVALAHAGRWPDTYTELGLTFVPLPAGPDGGKGLAIAPYTYGAAALSRDLDGWHLDLSSSADLQSGLALQLRPPHNLTLRADLFSEPQSAGSADIRFGLKIARTATEQPLMVLGAADTTRLTVENFGISFLAEKSTAIQTLALELDITKLLFVLQAGDGDGFLQKILPPEGLSATFDLAVGWSNANGVYFRGSASLELTIPVHKSVGPVVIDSVYVALATDGGVTLTLATTAQAQIGPVAASVQHMGIALPIRFPSDGSGNLGPVQIASPTFVPPTGAGLAVDVSGITGGGFLTRNIITGEYGGVLQLAFTELGLFAVGLIKPSANDFSMVILVSALFDPPIQLSFGFTLSGVGGLIAVNRSMNVEVLRAGLRSHALDAIVFPDDPVANAPMMSLWSGASARPQTGHS